MPIRSKILLLIFIGLHQLCTAQKCGKVIDNKTKKGIPYVTISLLNKPFGTISDEQGNFCFEIMQNKNDSVLISALGYEQQKLSVHDFLIFTDFFLLEKFTLLEEVTVKNKKSKSMLLGTFRKGLIVVQNSFCPNSSYIIASKINNPDRIEGVITKLHYRLQSKKSDFVKKFKVRCRVFKNGKDGFPSEDLLKENVILDIDPEEKIIEADVSSSNLSFEDEFLWVAIETIGYIDKQDNYISISEHQIGKVLYKKNQGVKIQKILSLSPHYLMSDEGVGLWRIWNQKWYKITNSKYHTPLFGVTLSY